MDSNTNKTPETQALEGKHFIVKDPRTLTFEETHGHPTWLHIDKKSALLIANHLMRATSHADDDKIVRMDVRMIPYNPDSKEE